MLHTQHIWLFQHLLTMKNKLPFKKNKLFLLEPLRFPDTIKWHFGIGAACGFAALLIAFSDTSKGWHGRGVVQEDTSICHHTISTGFDFWKYTENWLHRDSKTSMNEGRYRPLWILPFTWMPILWREFNLRLVLSCWKPTWLPQITSLLEVWLRNLKELNFRAPWNDSWRINHYAQ